MSTSKLKTNATPNKKVQTSIKPMLKDPETPVHIKTIRVYSQIARISKNPNKQEERTLLIKMLEDSRINVTVNGKTISKDPPFITMKAQDVKRCFNIQNNAKSSFLCADKNFK